MNDCGRPSQQFGGDGRIRLFLAEIITYGADVETNLNYLESVMDRLVGNRSATYSVAAKQRDAAAATEIRGPGTRGTLVIWDYALRSRSRRRARAAHRTGGFLLTVLAVGSMLTAAVSAADAAPRRCETDAWESISSTIPEARLTDQMKQRIRKGPDIPAPWDLSSSDGLVLWAMWPRPSDTFLLPAEIRDTALPMMRWGFTTRYSYTPVGPYNEIDTMIQYGRISKPGIYMHTPFIPVDSPDTAKNGRNNWGFPKTLADFTGSPRLGETLTASGPGWSVSVSSKPLPGNISMTLPEFVEYIRMPQQISFEQPSPACGLKTLRSLRLGGMSASVRLAVVTVKTEGSDELRALLPSGIYPAGYFAFEKLGFDQPGMN